MKELLSEISRIKTLMGLIAEAEAEDVKSSKKIVFRKQGDKDIGACIGIPHGGIINLSNDIIERIKKIPNLHFYAEGSAAKNPNDEPNMMPFINKNFPNYGIERIQSI